MPGVGCDWGGKAHRHRGQVRPTDTDRGHRDGEGAEFVLMNPGSVRRHKGTWGINQSFTVASLQGIDETVTRLSVGQLEYFWY